MTLQGYSKDTFGDKEQKAFATGMAKMLNVSSELVTVTVKDARRRLLATSAIAVDYEIAVADVAAAVNMQASIKAVPPDDLVVELKAAGMTEVGRCRLTFSKPVLKASLVSALETKI